MDKYVNDSMGKSYPSGKIRSFKPKIVFKEIKVNPTVILMMVNDTYKDKNHIFLIALIF